MPIQNVTETADTSATDVQESNADTFRFEDYEYWTFPDGSKWAVPKDAIRNSSDPNATVQAPPAEEPEVYLWLSDCTSVRVKQSQVPLSAGTNAPYGHYVKDGHTFLVVNVWPVETENAKG